MDRNTELLLAKAGQAKLWEDEEKASNDLEVLRKEFRQRLYADSRDGEAVPPPPVALPEERK